MRAVVQRVEQGSVEVEGTQIAAIARGFLVLVGVCEEDGPEDIEYICRKISGLRIFQDAAGKMNLALPDVEGAVLLVSQFTLYGNCRKGQRPSFSAAAEPQKAERLYDALAEALRGRGLEVQTGDFGAYMKVKLVNEGPVTLLLDSKKGI